MTTCREFFTFSWPLGGRGEGFFLMTSLNVATIQVCPKKLTQHGCRSEEEVSTVFTLTCTISDPQCIYVLINPRHSHSGSLWQCQWKYLMHATYETKQTQQKTTWRGIHTSLTSSFSSSQATALLIIQVTSMKDEQLTMGVKNIKSYILDWDSCKCPPMKYDWWFIFWCIISWWWEHYGRI